MILSTHRLSLDRIEAAAQHIDPVFLNSPQYECEALGQLLDVRLLLKVETFNPIRSFKGRGAEWYMTPLSAGTRVVCASAGNFGQAMAFAARKRGVHLTVFAAPTASPVKVERMRLLGADVILRGRDFDAAREEAYRYALETDARLVVDSLDVETAEGAATIGLELLRLDKNLDTLLIPLGNGAVCSGIARVMKARKPQTQILAVQARGASAMTESWRAGRPIAHESVNTIADGIATRVPIAEALEDLKGLLDEALLVDDSTIVQAMRLLHQHAGLVPEPSAAVGVAAILENPKMLRGQRVGSIICGGNLTPEQIRQWL